MGYPARTFYKCIGFDYCDLYRGTINFKRYIGGVPFALDTPIRRAVHGPQVCWPDVVHASPRPEQAAHYASHALRFISHGASPLDGSPRDPRLRMVECHGRPVVHALHGIPKYGFREIQMVRVIPPAEILEKLLDANYMVHTYGRYPMSASAREQDQFFSQIHRFCGIFFPQSGRLHEKYWAQRPRLPIPFK